MIRTMLHRRRRALALLALAIAAACGLGQLAPGTASALGHSQPACGGDIKQWLIYDSFYKGLAPAALARIGCNTPFDAVAIRASQNISGFDFILPAKGWSNCDYQDTQTITCQHPSAAVKHANAWIETDPFQGCPTGLKVSFAVRFADGTTSNTYSFGDCQGRFPTGPGRRPKTQVRVTPTGHIGALVLGRSTQADVVRRYGKPRAKIHPPGAVKPAMALEYDLNNATPTMFIFNQHTHRLSDLYTSSPRFVTPEGTSPGTFALVAQQNEKQGAQPIKTPNNCSDHGILLAAHGGRQAAVAYRSTFVALMYSVQYINLSSAFEVSPVFDNRMLVSGPQSVFAGPASSGGGQTAVRPVCYLSRRASRRTRR